MNRSLQLALVTAAFAPAATSCGVKYGDPIGVGTDGGGGGGGSAGNGGSDGDGNGGAGGSAGASVPLPATLPEFCTADGWCGSNLAFSGVWGSGAGDVWVIANGIADNPTASAVLHWNGQVWTTVLGLSDSYYGADSSDANAV